MNETVQTTDRTWDVLCHLSALAMLIGVPFGNIVGPLVVWLVKKSSSSSVDENGKEAINFQLSLTLYLLVATAVTLGLMFLLIGFLLLPVLIAALIVVPVIDVILIGVAAYKASNGEIYRYPLTIRFIN